MTYIPTQVATGGLDRLYDAIESSLPGVQHPVVQSAVWDTIDEFCTRSLVWRETMSWVLPAGMREVDLNPVSATAVVVWVIGVQGISAASVSPPAILIDSGDVSQARSGTARVACKPTRLSDQLPSFLVNNWYEALRDGTLARLYEQPAKPYSNMDLARFHGTRFRSGIRLARDAANRYFTNGTSGWRFPYFASGRRR